MRKVRRGSHGALANEIKVWLFLLPNQIFLSRFFVFPIGRGCPLFAVFEKRKCDFFPLRLLPFFRRVRSKYYWETVLKERGEKNQLGRERDREIETIGGS